MNNSWNWAGRYLAVIVVTLILGAALGSMDLFEKTAVFSGKLTASHLVRFLGYATALVAFWLLGQRATLVLRQQHGRWSFLQHLILPVVSLVFVAAAYSVLLAAAQAFHGCRAAQHLQLAVHCGHPGRGGMAGDGGVEPVRAADRGVHLIRSPAKPVRSAGRVARRRRNSANPAAINWRSE